MKVYIVKEFNCFGMIICWVFETREKAEKFKNSLDNSDNRYIISENEVM